ncbi:MAG: cell surface protein SprA [Bacteroidales bacterium]|nr:cell surface protein SprA [Bacteroidales bacterium]
MKLRVAVMTMVLFVAMAAKGMAMPSGGWTVSRVALSDTDTVARFPLPPSADDRTSPLFLRNPSNIKDTVEYDPESNDYMLVTRMGNTVLSRRFMTFDEYQNWLMQQTMNQYWRSKGQVIMGDASEESMLSNIPGFNEVSRKLEALMGKPEISITPTGSADLTFQLIYNNREDPMLDASTRRRLSFDFDENIQLSLNAKIGDLVSFDVNWNTQATFDFENQLKLKYEGKEDDILQLLEVGDISFPLTTTLIKGSQQLFGAHTKLKFGKLTLDLVVSQKETSTENLQVQGGASCEEFEIRADEYEENRHYFISQYFYENYNGALRTLPVVASNIKIIRMEVWRTNIGAAVTNNRDLLALADLGERHPANSSVTGLGVSTRPDKNANNLFDVKNKNGDIVMPGIINRQAVRDRSNINSYMQSKGFVNGVDYEKIESARLLASNEYTYNSQLGFISLSQPLSNDQMLAVAFQYQIIGDSNVYQVGELTTDGVNEPNTLIVKLLKGTSNNTHHPIWRLMMKNVYFLKSTQISPDKFRLNILYEDPEGGAGVGYFTEGPLEGRTLIDVFGFDRTDATMTSLGPDGVFDWFDSAAFKGGTIQAASGRIYFPYVEPFGKDLDSILGHNPEYTNLYCFDSLYAMPQTLARQYADKNKFYLEGYYTSAVSGEISLGYSVTKGSVTVTAGGMPLIENVDYTVDYTMGTVRIINESILASGTPISVSSENNSFSMMTKRMLGAHINYEFSPDFNLGATAMNLREKPLTYKNNFGEEPTSNSIMGLDLNYRHEVPFITRIVDMLPGIQTKAPSTLSLTAELAHFFPNMSNTGSADSKGRVSYIDDFEGSKSSIDLRGPSYWHLASTPRDTAGRFPETLPGSGLAYGMNRALLSWYRIDRTLYSGRRPSNINDTDDILRPYVRSIIEQEISPNKSLVAGEHNFVYELNLAYYPTERGPYNYGVDSVGSDGCFTNPQRRWGGIMRSLDYTDFESQNIETIEFWLMDPFMDPVTGKHDDNIPGGKFVINLGDISEDILRDGKKAFENGLPTSEKVVNVDTTIWGRVPTTQPIVNAFDNDEESRKYQDVGYDGLSSADEQTFFNDSIHGYFLDKMAAIISDRSSPAYAKLLADPSSDNFVHYFDNSYDAPGVTISDRYKYFSNPEGNSPVGSDNNERYSTTATNYPNVEDINRDNTLSEAENYYEYEIVLTPNMKVGENFIVDTHTSFLVEHPNGDRPPTLWYHFRIPIREPSCKVGTISGFQSIRFMRMYLTGFEKPIILRFASLELVYGTWRKYSESLLQPGDYVMGSEANTSFNISSVNIEEYGSRYPVPYNLPPGIEREQWYSTNSAATELDERSLSLDITDLGNGDARAVYRNTQYDLRYYDKLKMFVHAEAKGNENSLADDDLVLFVRLGSDYTSNYYEYEVPLKLTPWGVSKRDTNLIWPRENYVDIPLQKLVEIKTNRNNNYLSKQVLYIETIDGHRCSVLGSPNLGKVKVIMIGVRNPKKEILSDGLDMMPKSVVVWVNELRLSDYNSGGGGTAAMVLARTNLADIGNLSFYGAYTEAGFGNLEDNLNKLEQVNTLNIQTTLNLELGKFLPESWAMRIPFYIDYNWEHGTPKYNPLDPDVLSKNVKDSNLLCEDKKTTNITLANVHKDRVGKSALNPRFYDFENLSFSYAYSNERSSDEDIEHYIKDQHRGGFTYNYSVSQPKQIRPFMKSKVLQSKSLRIIGDFNVYYQPRSLTFTTEVYRDYEETLLRNKTNNAKLPPMSPTYFKQFTWRRDYGLQYDISRSLRLQFDASANCRIDEEPIVGRIDTREERDAMLNSIIHTGGGTKQTYSQNLNISWDVPIGKLPYMDFVRIPVTYRSTYNYTGPAPIYDKQGGILENSGTFNATATANFQTLYNKSKFLKKAYQPPKPKKKTVDKAKDKAKEEAQERIGVRRDPPKAEPLLTPEQQDSIRKERNHERMLQTIYFGARFATCIKNISAQWNYTTGSRVAGFMGEPQVMGLDLNKQLSPGWGFVFGRPVSVIESMRSQGYLSRDPLMNTPSMGTGNKVFSMQGTVEPIRDMKIEITCSQNHSSREEYYYKCLSDEGEVEGPLSYTMTGSYTSTAWTWRTALRDPDQLYQDFRDARIIVAERLAAMNRNPYPDIPLPDSLVSNFPAGYSANSQTVLLTSFLATYLGKDPNSIGFSPFMDMPLPNWNINYSGLGKLELLKQWFTNITLSHRYSSTYSVGNFYTSPELSGKTNGYDYGSETELNPSGDYIPPVSMEGVQFSEQFNPLIKVAVNMVNSLQFNFSYQCNRTLGLSFVNNQLTETTRNGLTIGGGYRFKDVKIKIKTAEKTHNLKSDVVLQLNITRNVNETLIRRINSDIDQVSSGSTVWMGELSGEYALSSTLTLRAFIQTNINTPHISSSYPNSSTKGGLTIRFSF